jgi:hypothetical protein
MSVCTFRSSVDAGCQHHQLCLSCCVICGFPALTFVTICPPQIKWCPKAKIKVNVLNWNNKVKIWGLLESELTLVEVGWHYGKNGPSIRDAVLNSMHPEHGGFFSMASASNQIPMETKGLLYRFVLLLMCISFAKCLLSRVLTNAT